MGKFANKLKGEAGEFVLFDEFIQIHGKEFKRDTNMVAEREWLVAVYDIVGVLLVLFAQVFQDANFFLSLAMEALLVAHNF